jgi:NADH dehydrogenase
MRIFVTGAGSALGRDLCRRLAAHELIALRHRAPVPGTPIDGSLDRPASYAPAVRGCDAVLHLAAVTHARRREDYYRVNLAGTRALLSACASVGHFVFVSTRTAGGAYADSKRRAEAAVRAGGIPWTIFQPSELWTPDGREGLAALLRLAGRLRLFPIPILPSPPPLAPVRLDEAAAAIARSIGDPRCFGRTYVLAGARPAGFAELRRRLRPRSLPIPLPLLPLHAGAAAGALPGVAPDQIARLLSEKPSDSEAARRDLGFEPKEWTA